MVLAAGSALIDCSTVDVDSARDVAAMAGEAGLLAVDAPVSGGVGGARSGSLTFMAGGPDAGFALAATAAPSGAVAATAPEARCLRRCHRHGERQNKGVTMTDRVLGLK